jgi:hypothetical protein
MAGERSWKISQREDKRAMSIMPKGGKTVVVWMVV